MMEEGGMSGSTDQMERLIPLTVQKAPNRGLRLEPKVSTEQSVQRGAQPYLDYTSVLI